MRDKIRESLYDTDLKTDEIESLTKELLDLYDVSNDMATVKCSECGENFKLQYSENAQVDTLKIGVARDSYVYDIDIECPKCLNVKSVY